MNLLLQRQPTGSVCTLGDLFIDGTFECFCLEDVTRDKKVFGETAIPAGTYKIGINFSPHFQRNLPILLNVPGFEGVRIHPGNTDKDTEGCILVGNTINGDSIGDSRAAFEHLYVQINSALMAGESVSIEITNP